MTRFYSGLSARAGNLSPFARLHIMLDLEVQMRRFTERKRSLPRWMCIAVILFVATGFHGLVAGEEISDYEKGLAFRLEGKNRQAVEAFARVLAADPGNVQALTQKGAALEDQGKWKQAIQAYRQALEADPNHRFARRNLEQLRSLHMVNSSPAGANPVTENLLNSGLRAVQRGDFSRAAEVFRLAQGLSADDPRPMFFWALTLQEQGKTREAGAMYQKTVDSFPDYVPARINLIISLLTSGQIGEAGQEARKSLTAFPESHEIQALHRFLQQGGYRSNAKQTGMPMPGRP